MSTSSVPGAKREPVDVARLRELCDAATPGNWRVAMHGYNVKSDLTGTPHDGDYLDNICAVPCGPKATLRAVRQFQNDAEFIAAARTALPAYLDLIEELRAALDKYGAHQIQCACHFTREPCDCGLDAIRAALENK